MAKPMRSWIYQGNWKERQPSAFNTCLREATEAEVALFILGGGTPLKVETCTGTSRGPTKCGIEYCQPGVGFRILYAEESHASNH